MVGTLKIAAKKATRYLQMTNGNVSRKRLIGLKRHMEANTPMPM